jgi:hypothetical protein
VWMNERKKRDGDRHVYNLTSAASEKSFYFKFLYLILDFIKCKLCLAGLFEIYIKRLKSY